MDDLGDPDFDHLFNLLRNVQERRRSLVSSNEDIAGTHESVDGQWSEWMCPECGIFMREDQHRCRRCQASRL